MSLDPTNCLSSLTRWEKTALGAWSLVLAVVCVRAAFWPMPHSVYPIFELASHKWLAGQNLYLLTQYDVYRYSPLVAAAFIPLGLLPTWLGGVLWRLLGAGVYLAALIWWGRITITRGGPAAEQRRTDRNWLALFLLLVLPLSLDNLGNGQSNVLMIGLVMFSILASGARRWNLAAGCAAAACLLKIYPLAAALLLAVLYPRRFTPRFVAVLAAGLLLPFVLQRPSYVLDQYATWIGYLRADKRQGEILELWYRDLRLLAQVCGMPLADGTYVLIQAAAGACIAGVCWAARRSGWLHEKLGPLVLGLSCCWMTAFGAAAETSTYMILAPMAAWCMVDAWRRPCQSWLRFSYLGIYLLLGIARAAGSFPNTRRFSMVVQPGAALLLLVVLLGTAIRQLRAPRSFLGEACFIEV